MTKATIKYNGREYSFWCDRCMALVDRAVLVDSGPFFDDGYAHCHGKLEHVIMSKLTSSENKQVHVFENANSFIRR